MTTACKTTVFLKNPDLHIDYQFLALSEPASNFVAGFELARFKRTHLLTKSDRL